MSLVVGSIVAVPHLEESGLTLATNLYVRATTASLFGQLNASSTLVEGPPGVGKSTTVWLWLMHSISDHASALWAHYRKLGSTKFVVIRRTGDQLLFQHHESTATVTDKNFGIVVADGIRTEILREVTKDLQGFRAGKQVYVTSQQVVIPEEHLMELDMVEFYDSSWTNSDVEDYASKMDTAQQNQLLVDYQGTTSQNSTFNESIESKYWYFGGSARYMFGMTMQRALNDLEKHASAVPNAELVLNALSGSRGVLAVNHIIACFPGAARKYTLLSNHVIHLLSARLGFAAIKMFYRSPWVRGNPSVHGFVFEWDLFTQVEETGNLALSSREDLIEPMASDLETTWPVDEIVSWRHFLSNSFTATSRIMVRPEKWNQPEYDGLYIHQNQPGQRELVAWNASEALNHKGSVTKLTAFLREIGTRQEDPINFDKVRFVFILPVGKLASFELPNQQQTLMAKNQLYDQKFTDFEKLGAIPTAS